MAAFNASFLLACVRGTETTCHRVSSPATFSNSRWVSSVLPWFTATTVTIMPKPSAWSRAGRRCSAKRAI